MLRIELRTMDFKDYPDDSRLYFIRWIDRYTKPHKGSTSTSVCCYLAPLPDDIKDPAKATPDQIAKLFGYSEQMPFVARVLVGALPSIRIGYVYRDGKRVGVLPSRALSLGDALSKAEGSGKYGRSIQLDTVIGKDGDFPIKAVPTSQLHLEHSVRFRSGMLIAEDSASGIEFLIPRSLIFRTFYARSTYLASVFTTGIWDETVGRVIFLDKEFAGNWTRELQDPHCFHLVMERGMHKGDAESVALLHFGSCVCWNFLDELERAVSYEQRVRKGWAFLHQEGRRSGGLERGALVVGVTLSDGRTGFWIEIQTRQGAMTPLVIDDGSDPDAQISRALNVIFSARGSNLEDHFRTASMKAYCFPHRYVSQEMDEDVDEGKDDGKKREHKKEWDKDWLIAFFKSVSGSKHVAAVAAK